MRYSDVQQFVAAQLTAVFEYGVNPSKPLPVFSPGPAADQIVQKAGPNALVFLTVGGGSAQGTEGLFDKPFIAVRAIGKQMDYDSAECLASDVDAILLSVSGNSLVGNANVLYVVRSGGGPLLLQQDAANRYHFSCSYIVETQAAQIPIYANEG